MTICEFCLHHSAAGTCELGLKPPKTMRCREFDPGIEKFCADPADFVSQTQIVEMARYFGFDRTELKKIRIVVERRVTDDAAKHINA